MLAGTAEEGVGGESVVGTVASGVGSVIGDCSGVVAGALEPAPGVAVVAASGCTSLSPDEQDASSTKGSSDAGKGTQRARPCGAAVVLDGTGHGGHHRPTKQ